MNAVILTSVLSAGNHALFAGTRVLYSLAQPLPDHISPSSGSVLCPSTVSSTDSRPRLPRRLAPALFARTTARGVPLFALLATASVSLLCVGASRVGAGELWGWLQNLVGVSNQLAWLSIGLASWRFRAAWDAQGRPREELVFRAGWTWGWGPPFVVIATAAIILSACSRLGDEGRADTSAVQGWSSFAPFDVVDFASLYVELPLMGVMAAAYWLFIGRRLKSDVRSPHADAEGHADEKRDGSASSPPPHEPAARSRSWLRSDVPSKREIDLYADEITPEEDEDPDGEEARRARRTSGRWGWAWKVYYVIA
jgi:AAT family amino acid transporter